MGDMDSIKWKKTGRELTIIEVHYSILYSFVYA
jgi:hypothetical protein